MCVVYMKMLQMSQLFNKVRVIGTIISKCISDGGVTLEEIQRNFMGQKKCPLLVVNSGDSAHTEVTLKSSNFLLGNTANLHKQPEHKL